MSTGEKKFASPGELIAFLKDAVDIEHDMVGDPCFGEKRNGRRSSLGSTDGRILWLSLKDFGFKQFLYLNRAGGFVYSYSRMCLTALPTICGDTLSIEVINNSDDTSTVIETIVVQRAVQAKMSVEDANLMQALFQYFAPAASEESDANAHANAILLLAKNCKATLEKHFDLVMTIPMKIPMKIPTNKSI